MQLSRSAVGLAASVCLALTPAYAGPQKAHGNPHTAARPTGNPHTAAKPTGNPHTATRPHDNPHVATAAQKHTHTRPIATTGTPTENPIAKRIESRPQLASRLTPLLPAGMTLDDAAKGFRNQGQFIAALHVSRNLNIPFAQLKAEMTGKDHDSLGRAIQDLRPGVNASAEARRAQNEANEDLKIRTIAKAKHGDRDNDRDKDRDDR